MAQYACGILSLVHSHRDATRFHVRSAIAQLHKAISAPNAPGKALSYIAGILAPRLGPIGHSADVGLPPPPPAVRSSLQCLNTRKTNLRRAFIPTCILSRSEKQLLKLYCILTYETRMSPSPVLARRSLDHICQITRRITLCTCAGPKIHSELAIRDGQDLGTMWLILSLRIPALDRCYTNLYLLR